MVVQLYARAERLTVAPISVLVVDDSVVMRRLITGALENDPGIQVMATAANGKLAIEQIAAHMPDAVTLDIEMPTMTGLEAIKIIHARWPRLPVIMFSTLTERGGAATLEALASGAADYVTKPSNVGNISESMARVRDELVPKIKALAAPAAARVQLASNPVAPGASGPSVAPMVLPRQIPPAAGQARPANASAARPSAATGLGPVDVLAVGCSTGGPEALTQVLKGLPANFAVPIVVVQHMPKIFTKLFAERLDAGTNLHVHEASDAMSLQPGHVYIAPGDYHMVLKRQANSVVTVLNQAAPENFCRPAVDPLFRSVAQTYGGKVLAVVLTGMGSDGRAGAQSIKQAGGTIIAQDEATSVVWGMPGAVTTAGLASSVIPLPEIAALVLSAVRPGARAGSAAPATAGRGMA